MSSPASTRAQPFFELLLLLQTVHHRRTHRQHASSLPLFCGKHALETAGRTSCCADSTHAMSTHTADADLISFKSCVTDAHTQRAYTSVIILLESPHTRALSMLCKSHAFIAVADSTHTHTRCSRYLWCRQTQIRSYADSTYTPRTHAPSHCSVDSSTHTLHEHIQLLHGALTAVAADTAQLQC